MAVAPLYVLRRGPAAGRRGRETSLHGGGWLALHKLMGGVGALV